MYGKRNSKEFDGSGKASKLRQLPALEAQLPVYQAPLRRRRQNNQTLVFAECLR